MTRWTKFWTPGSPHGLPGDRRGAAGTSRRAFLGGAGVLLTLPLLESLDSRAATAPRPVRAIWWYAPCGMVMDQWRPANTGTLGALPPILTPLEALKSEILVISGLTNTAAMVPVAGDHARGTGSFLTCRTVEHSADTIVNGISVDQVAAQAIGSETSFRSLELGTTGGSSVGDCDSGYSCAYSRNVSWLDENTPNPKLTDPGLVFDRLFSGMDSTETAEQQATRQRWRTSVLDHVLEESHTLEGLLSTSDRAKLDEYMTGLRELESRIQTGPDGPTCAPGDRPDGLDYAFVTRAMSDLTVLALQCDVTRLVTFMLENGASGRSFDFLGVSGAHHELSHHGGDSGKIAGLATIGTWEVEEFAYLLGRLAATTEADGTTLLDHTVAFLSSEISDGDRHNHDDLPVLLAGRAGGKIVPGRHVEHLDRPIADLYLSMLDAVGAPQASFGIDGTAPIDLG